MDPEPDLIRNQIWSGTVTGTETPKSEPEPESIVSAPHYWTDALSVLIIDVAEWRVKNKTENLQQTGALTTELRHTPHKTRLCELLQHA
jgi:hypothetical protein